MKIQIELTFHSDYSESIEKLLNSNVLENNAIIGNCRKGGNDHEFICVNIKDTKQSILEMVWLKIGKMLFVSTSVSKEDGLLNKSLKVTGNDQVKTLLSNKICHIIGLEKEIQISIRILNAFLDSSFKTTQEMKMNLYKLKILKKPMNPLWKDLTFHRVSINDTNLKQVVEMMEEFERETFPDRVIDKEQLEQRTRSMIQANRVSILKLSDEMVAVAQIAAYIPNLLIRGGHVYVKPKYRSKGLGQCMTYLFCKKVTEWNIPTMCLFADVDNPISNHIYQKLGFLCQPYPHYSMTIH